MSDQDEVGLANQSDVRTLIEWALNAPIVLTMADPGHICKCSLGFPYLPYGAYQPEDCLQNTCRLHLYIYFPKSSCGQKGRAGDKEWMGAWLWLLPDCNFIGAHSNLPVANGGPCLPGI